VKYNNVALQSAVNTIDDVTDLHYDLKRVICRRTLTDIIRVS